MRCHVLEPQLGEVSGLLRRQGTQIICRRWLGVLAIREPRPTDRSSPRFEDEDGDEDEYEASACLPARIAAVDD